METPESGVFGAGPSDHYQKTLLLVAASCLRLYEVRWVLQSSFDLTLALLGLLDLDLTSNGFLISFILALVLQTINKPQPFHALAHTRLSTLKM